MRHLIYSYIFTVIVINLFIKPGKLRLIVFDSKEKKVQLLVNKVTVIVLKNDVCCKDCQQSLINAVEGKSMEKILVLSYNKDTHPLYIRENYDRTYNSGDIKQVYFDQFNLKNSSKIYPKFSLFRRFDVNKTPHVLLINNGTIENWPYERIFCYSSPVRINDTLITRFNEAEF